MAATSSKANVTSANEYDLENDIFLTFSTYKKDRVVSVRKFIMKANGGGKYPTKTGVCLSLQRFVALLAELENIDNAYNFVSLNVGAERVVHIGGGLFGSVSHDFKCVNLRYFFKNQVGMILPSRQGIALPLVSWEALKLYAPQLKSTIADIDTIERCNTGRLMHYGQESYFQCRECNPFYNEFESITMPSEYNVLLDGVSSLPPAKSPLPLLIDLITPVSTPTSGDVEVPAVPMKKRRVNLVRQLTYE
jgi:Transcriptional Coactivator p15 (PC4)